MSGDGDYQESLTMAVIFLFEICVQILSWCFWCIHILEYFFFQMALGYIMRHLSVTLK